MFVRFFYMLRERGVPVTLTAFLRLQRALAMGLVVSLEDLYTIARSILVKSEEYFDIYDQVFSWSFQGQELSPAGTDLDEIVRSLFEEWLQVPEELSEFLGIDKNTLERMTPDELMAYFLARLREQTSSHHGGNRWIGTGGTAPAGHSGNHDGGLRVGGVSRNRSAIAVAMDRRYRDYSRGRPLTQSQVGEALKRLRRMVPSGPRDEVNVSKTIYETMKNCGEIEIVFDRRLADRLKVILMIDNGGWSMDPYVRVVQTLFDYARNQFKDLNIFYFHNTIYDSVWSDPERMLKPQRINDLASKDPETRVIIVGDASMAPYELIYSSDSFNYPGSRGGASTENLKFIARNFRHCAWLNPRLSEEWGWTWTIEVIREILPMFELTIEGLEEVVAHLMRRN